MLLIILTHSMAGSVTFCFDVTRLLQSGVEIVLKKIGHEPSGGKFVKSQEISVFIILSCWISLSNRIHLSRPNCTQILILCIVSLNSAFAIIEH